MKKRKKRISSLLRRIENEQDCARSRALALITPAENKRAKVIRSSSQFASDSRSRDIPIDEETSIVNKSIIDLCEEQKKKNDAHKLLT